MAKPPAAEAVLDYAVPEDGNEEMCGACRGVGILLCCEACPAAYHAQCAGYADEEEVPDGEWLCWSCTRAVGAKFMHPTTPIAKCAGDDIMVASSRDAELFYLAKVVAASPTNFSVRFGPDFKNSLETFPRTSVRLWHGSLDLETVWEARRGGGYQPLARAYAVDYERVMVSSSPKPALLPFSSTQAGAVTQRSQRPPTAPVPVAKRPAGVGAPEGMPPAKRPRAGPELSVPKNTRPIIPPELVARYPLAAKLADLHTECRRNDVLEVQRRALLDAMRALQPPAPGSLWSGTFPPAPQPLQESRPQLPRPRGAVHTASKQPYRGSGTTVAGFPLSSPTLQQLAALEREPPPLLLSNVFGGQVQVPYHRSFQPAGSEGDFLHHLMRFWAVRDMRPLSFPIRYYQDRILNVWKLWQQVTARGGFTAVEKSAAWQQVGKVLDPGAPLNAITHNARVQYMQLLLEFEKASRAGTSGFQSSSPATLKLATSAAKMKPPRPAGSRPRAASTWSEIPGQAAARLPGGDGSPGGNVANAGSGRPSQPSMAASGTVHKGGQASREPWMVPPPLPHTWVLPPLPGSSDRSVTKSKAQPVPNPRKPPVKNQRLVGPLNPSARGRLCPGDLVEVRQQSPGFRGSWYLARTLQVAKGSVAEGGWRYLVQYEAFTVAGAAAARVEAVAEADVLRAEQLPEAQYAPVAGDGGLQPGAGEALPVDAPSSAPEAVPQLAAQPQAAGEGATEWVALISRSTLDAAPQLLLRRPRLALPLPPQELETGCLVEVQWRGGWWEAALLGRSEGGHLHLQSPPEPDGENELWEAPPDQVRCADPEGAGGYGMTACVVEDDMIPLDRYRRWLRPHDCRCEGFPIESYACAEQLPGSYMYVIQQHSTGTPLPSAPSPVVTSPASASNADPPQASTQVALLSAPAPIAVIKTEDFEPDIGQGNETASGPNGAVGEGTPLSGSFAIAGDLPSEDNLCDKDNSSTYQSAENGEDNSVSDESGQGGMSDYEDEWDSQNDV